MGDKKTFEGGCHCGRVRFRVHMPQPAEAVECNCTVCAKKGILHCFVSKDDFELLSGQDAITDYQFNKKIAHHYFCKVCGIHSFYIPRSHPDQIDVNLRCIDGLDFSALPKRIFDGQNWEASIAALRERSSA